MLRRFLLVGMALLASTGMAQNIPLEQSIRNAKWDRAHQVLFFGLGVLHRGLPIRSYFNSMQRGSDIDVFKDFPGVQRVLVFDAAAGPDEITVLSVNLNYPGNVIRRLLLTYDGGASLRSIWDTEPYEALAITTDEMGDVFSLGPLLGSQRSKPYPLVNEYDANGNVVKQLLYSNVFHEGPQAVDPGVGDDAIYPSLSVRGDKLYLYAPVEREVLICTVAGAIVTREGLAATVQAIVKEDKVESAGITNVAFVDDAHIALQIEEHPTADIVTQPKVYIVNLSTKAYSLMDRPQDGQFIGITNNGEVLMLDPSAAGDHAVLRSYDVVGTQDR
jgi:hypothetical protein